MSFGIYLLFLLLLLRTFKNNMRLAHYIIVYTFFFFASQPVSATLDRDSVQHTDATDVGRYVHQLMFDFKPGAILHTNEFLRGNNPEMRTMNHDMGFHLKYAFSAPEQSRTMLIYRDAYQGVGVAYNDFNPQLGNPLSVYLLQGARIASCNDRLSLNYEWNLGLAFGWNPYDEFSNPDNKVIGSHVTAYIGLGFYLRWILSRHIDLNAGVDAAHYSNGNTKYPNFGLNTVALRIGATYCINRQSSRLLHRHTPVPPSERGLSYDFIAYGAWRQMALYGDDYSLLLEGKAAVCGFNFNPMYRINHWLKFGASLDGIYDRTANLIELPTDGYETHTPYERPSAAKQMALGLSARAEFTMPYFAVNVGIGHNILNATGEFSGVYEILALKINVTRHALLHIGYSLNNFHTPRHLMLGVGWRFGKTGM